MKNLFATVSACGLALLVAACSQNPPTTPSTPPEQRAMSAKVYEAYRITESNSRERLGRIAIEGGKLSIVSLVNEADRAYVQKSLDEFNNRPFLVDKAPPESGERYSLGATEFERGKPGFDEALIRKLESGRAIRLEPAK
jgi:hypothetical protein